MATRNRVRIITFSGVIITLYPVIMRTRFYKPRFFLEVQSLCPFLFLGIRQICHKSSFFMQFCNVIYN